MLTTRVVWIWSFVVLLLAALLLHHAWSDCTAFRSTMSAADILLNARSHIPAKRSLASCVETPSVGVFMCVVLTIACLLRWISGSTLNLGGDGVERLYHDLDRAGRERVDNAARLTIITIGLSAMLVMATGFQLSMFAARSRHRLGRELLWILGLEILLMLIGAVPLVRFLRRLMRAEWARVTDSPAE